MAKTFTLWGFHPAYKGKDGYPYPLRLAIGSLREVNGERNRRLKESAQWVTGTYAKGVAPVGLRLQCDNAYPQRSRVGE